MSLVAEGPEIRVCGRDWVEPGERVGQVGVDLAGPDDDQVEVGHQGERAAALPGAVVQDDRAGLGDRDRAARHDPGHPVEFGRRERRGVPGQLDGRGQRGQPSGRQPVRHDEGTGRGGGAFGQDPGDGRGEAGLGDPLDDGAVVGGPLGEQVRDAAGRGVVVGAQVLPGQGRVRRVGARPAGAPPAVVAPRPLAAPSAARRWQRRLAGRLAARILARIWSLDVLIGAVPWSWPTRRGTIPAAGRGRRGFRSSRSAAAAAA